MKSMLAMIAPFLSAKTEEELAQINLEKAQKKREAAEALNEQFQGLVKARDKLATARNFATSHPIEFVIKTVTEESDAFGGDEIQLLSAERRAEEKYAGLANHAIFSASVLPFSMSDESNYGDLASVHAFLIVLRDSPKLREIKSRAQTYAAAQAKEMAALHDAAHAELGKWCKAQGTELPPPLP